MSLTDFAYHTAERIRRRLGLATPVTPEDFKTPADVAARMPEAHQTELASMFFDHDGRNIHKWMHYFAIYERYFDRFRGQPIRFLEIGIFKGGSIELWRRYLGDAASIWGIDIDPRCAERVDAPNHVRIGSQADPAFLRSVAAEMGGIDIVLDDGSHVADHQRVSFDTLFPLLNDGGIYMVEDCHTAYWPIQWNGGYRRSTTAIERAKLLVDDMHHWYHGHDFATAARGDIGAVHFHDSIVVIEKRAAKRPVDTEVGTARERA